MLDREGGAQYKRIMDRFTTVEKQLGSFDGDKTDKMLEMLNSSRIDQKSLTNKSNQMFEKILSM